MEPIMTPLTKCFWTKGYTIIMGTVATTTVEYFNRSIEGGSDLGYLRLGIAYEEGKGVAQDLNSALDCFHKALEIIGGPNASGSISADNVKKELDRMVTAGTIDQATADAIMAGNVG